VLSDFALVHQILDKRAALSPSASAVRHGGVSRTYRELRYASLCYASWLRSLGVRKGDRVVIGCPSSAIAAALIYATSRLGALYVVVGDQITPYLLRHVVTDSEPVVVVVAASPPAPIAEAAGPALQIVPDWDSVPKPAVLPAQPCLSVDPVSLIYTSGSTSMPKGVLSAHREVLFVARAIQSRLGYRPDDVIFCCLPLSFDYGLYQLFLGCLAGATVVLGGPGDAGPPLVTALREHAATILPAVPTLVSVLTRLLGRPYPPTLRIRMITNTGAALPAAQVDRLATLLPDTTIVPMFGLTECKRVTITPLGGYRPGSSGVPLPDTDVYVVDDRDRRLPPGEVGELVVRGPHVMSGYWRAPALTAQRFRRDAVGARLLYTGDLCRLDADGHLYFLGRRDDIYKQHGMRVSATEVEAAALDIDGVDCAALLPPTADAGALLLVTGGLSEGAVLAELATRLDAGRMPPQCRVVGRIPVRANGKIDRLALAAGARAGPP
jgi:acyl-CoA synthetase (AMP-forming)/AMP-acid ligase II